MFTDTHGGEPLVAGEALTTRPGFWAAHLAELCAEAECATAPDPERFGADEADTDAMFEVLFDPDRWPVLRVPVTDGPTHVVIHYNADGECGVVRVRAQPTGDADPPPRYLPEEPVRRPGPTWAGLTRIADGPPGPGDGVRDPAARLLLLLPLVEDPDPAPPAVRARVVEALLAVGAPRDTVHATADHLLGHLAHDDPDDPDHHDHRRRSPLSGG
ncbi:hypothetical protein ACN20G_33815 (plasmid) [Streptomyces sp. BI20]|uniref:hypothetical protein n=1 Tax=Streptomyces sp. BI20 TaxID=3403460 RepID=UPI003C712E7D